MDTVEAAGICCCATEEDVKSVIVTAEQISGIYSDLLELLEHYKAQKEKQ